MTTRELLCLAATVSGVKLLAAYGYRSTDFEVHRNWMSITSKLPITEWYTHSLSEWTLDYPPFFAYFEWALSAAADKVDANMTIVENLEYASEATVLFQRASVVGGDLCFVLTAALLLRRFASASLPPSAVAGAVAAVSLNPGLFIVDNVHFQYNSLLYALLLLCFLAASHRRYVLCGVLFGALLCCKHIFLYMAPAFFVVLLRRQVFGWGEGEPRARSTASILAALVRLGLPVLAVFAACVAPFVQQLDKLAGRLFPFGRGLCHAYWAPNVYALYNAADLALQRAGGASAAAAAAACETCVNTRGLVDTYKAGARTHVVLPTLSPRLTTLVTLATVAALGCVYLRWCRRRQSQASVRVDASVELMWLCALSSAAFFTFSWHVHEKAILMVSVPLTALAFAPGTSSYTVSVISNVVVAGTLSLFPLMFEAAELPFKLALAGLLMLLFPAALRLPQREYGRLMTVDAGLVCAVFAAAVLQGLHLLSPWRGRLPFLPLMALSCVAAASLLLSFVRLTHVFVTEIVPAC